MSLQTLDLLQQSFLRKVRLELKSQPDEDISFLLCLVDLYAIGVSISHLEIYLHG
jgi:hypothetical protein